MVVNSGNALTLAIAALAIAGVIVRPARLPEAIWAVAGALAVVALGLVPWPDALGAVGKGLDVYLFLTGMMLLAAPVTTTPLILFSYGARRLPLSLMGFLQYVTPTLQVALATFCFGEEFTHGHAVAFVLIWAGIAVYSWPQRRAAAPEPG